MWLPIHLAIKIAGTLVIAKAFSLVVIEFSRTAAYLTRPFPEYELPLSRSIWMKDRNLPRLLKGIRWEAPYNGQRFTLSEKIALFDLFRQCTLMIESDFSSMAPQDQSTVLEELDALIAANQAKLETRRLTEQMIRFQLVVATRPFTARMIEEGEEEEYDYES